MIDKRHLEILERLDKIEAILAGKSTAKTKVAKADLTAIKGVGSQTADEILKLLNK